MKTFIKLLALIGIGALVYWFVRERLGGEPDEFTFTEVTDAVADDAAGAWPPPCRTPPKRAAAGSVPCR
jgi:hypothetical protein